VTRPNRSDYATTIEEKKNISKKCKKTHQFKKPDAKGEENSNAYTMSQAAMSLMHLP